MLQIDHIYEFFYEHIFRDFGMGYLNGGVTNPSHTAHGISIFNRRKNPKYKMFFYDQEPLLPPIAREYFDIFDHADLGVVPRCIPILVTSEQSQFVNDIVIEKNYHNLYYFFHGFAAVDWYRGHLPLNYAKKTIRTYPKDFISYNRIIVTDRSYRINFISELIAKELLEFGLISFATADDDPRTWQDEINHPKTKLSQTAIDNIKQNLPQIQTPLIIDHPKISGSASADILRTIQDHDRDLINVDAFWHVVPETVFYYDKLHLTEKIFKPIVCKQPFMLMASPGNLEYLKSYGFKTFDSVIDESYDTETDNDLRIQKVVAQLNWYCCLSPQEKTRVQQELEPIIEYNFRHFYGEFKHIITTELLQNCQTLFKQIGYDDSAIAYKELYRVLTN